jgi:hypothetical protein
MGALAGELPTGHLLRWQVVVHEGTEPYSEVVIYLDGLVVSKTVSEGKATYHRARANPGALARLRAKLTENHVGLQPTVACESDALFPNASGPYDATVTWFGKLGRQSRFVLSTVGEPPRCGAEPENIALAIQDFLGDVSFGDVVFTVP